MTTDSKNKDDEIRAKNKKIAEGLYNKLEFKGQSVILRLKVNS